MRRRRNAALAGAAMLALAASGCGGSGSSGQREENRALDAFFDHTARGHTLGAKFPHRPGSIGCKVLDRELHRRVNATCATDVAVGPKRVVVTFTESWSHGSRTHTWFVFLSPDGKIQAVTQEGVAPSG